MPQSINVFRMELEAESMPTQFHTSGLNYTVGSLTEEEYRRWIEHTFKPLFEPYEQSGGMLCRELLNKFRYSNHGLPKNRRNDLILFLDTNRDGRITYQVRFDACNAILLP